ncbi:hypothetical protein BDW59DRAFT_137313 [Aspergillus cavernicola]|uniref:Uncharacterized protein n=1 Tax=Aspergillus cavernicola TaxID=176166 RepID=A0ABR4J592_9EURO
MHDEVFARLVVASFSLQRIEHSKQSIWQSAPEASWPVVVLHLEPNQICKGRLIYAPVMLILGLGIVPNLPFS